MRLIENSTDLARLRIDSGLDRCAFVPTMGALHEGHASLVRAAIATGRPVVVSIFVNPTQFGPNEDYGRYPRTLAADCALLAGLEVAAVYAPSVEEIYPRGLEAAAREAASLALPEVALTPQLEDACRPGHFGGVALVVNRLFELVDPATAHFGEKDFQQLRLIEECTRADPTRANRLEICRCPTIREADGLAMSSRNRYLSDGDRLSALALSRALAAAADAAVAGEDDAPNVAAAERAMHEILRASGPAINCAIEYAVVRDACTLRPVADFSQPTRALIAARVGSTRLIDNRAIAPRR